MIDRIREENLGDDDKEKVKIARDLGLPASASWDNVGDRMHFEMNCGDPPKDDQKKE